MKFWFKTTEAIPASPNAVVVDRDKKCFRINRYNNWERFSTQLGRWSPCTIPQEFRFQNLFEQKRYGVKHRL